MTGDLKDLAPPSQRSRLKSCLLCCPEYLFACLVMLSLGGATLGFFQTLLSSFPPFIFPPTSSHLTPKSLTRPHENLN
jgi:hypothetical protein